MVPMNNRSPKRIKLLLSKQIYSFRVQKGLTQTELARLAGTTQPKISDWENGMADIKVTHLIGLCEALEVSPIEFLSPLVEGGVEKC